MTAPTPEARSARDPDHDERLDALAERLFEATLGAFDLLAVHLGSRLGLYDVLADGQARTAAEVAASAGIAPRYAVEWLEHQAVGGLIDVDDPAAATHDRRYRLPSGHAEVLIDERSLSLMAPMADFVVAAAGRAEELKAAYRHGGGIPWDGYGNVLLEAQGAVNRPVFEALLPTEWVPAMADVDARLREPGARIADVACGVGWSSLALARAYPGAHVDGIDLDAWSIGQATANAAEAGLADRVSFSRRDAADPLLEGRYQLVTLLEALHDFAKPVEVLQAARRMLAPGGAVLVVDERVAEQFPGTGDEIERLMYGYSILFCLPNALVEQPSVATGTVLRPSVVEAYAREAGFASVTVLPIEHDTFRLYRLDP